MWSRRGPGIYRITHIVQPYVNVTSEASMFLQIAIRCKHQDYLLQFKVNVEMWLQFGSEGSAQLAYTFNWRLPYMPPLPAFCPTLNWIPCRSVCPQLLKYTFNQIEEFDWQHLPSTLERYEALQR